MDDRVIAREAAAALFTIPENQAGQTVVVQRALTVRPASAGQLNRPLAKSVRERVRI
jgi:hypothetical protein